MSAWGALAERWLPWTPVPLAVVYLLELATQFNKIVGATYLNADTASAPVIGVFAGHGNGPIVLGKLPWYSTLMFELATRSFPLHRQLWEAAPYAMALLSFALVADAVRRVGGRLAGALAASVLICAGAPLLSLLFGLDDHSPTWFSVALLGWWVVILERVPTGSRRRAVALLVGGILIAFVAGVNAASDSLLLVGGILPLVLAGVIAFGLEPGRATRNASLAAVATAVLAVLFALLTVHVAHDNDVTHAGVYLFGEPGHVQGNLSLWWQGLAFIGNGDFFGAAVGFTSVLAAACAVIVLAAAVGALRVGWLDLHAVAGPSQLDAHGTAGRLRHRQPVEQPIGSGGARRAHIGYWVSAGIAMSLAFIVSADPEGLEAGHYLPGVLYASVAVVVLFVDRGRLARAVVAGGATIYCLAGTIAMVRGTADTYTLPSPSDAIAGEVATLAKREHLVRGYAGYWDAAPITWATHLRVHVFPVRLCGPMICAFYLHTVASWYRPHPGERTFLLTDPTQPFLESPPPSLGTPTASYQVGPDTMYVYSYDIATRIAPPAG
jgi:hypothetical protein